MPQGFASLLFFVSARTNKRHHHQWSLRLSLGHRSETRSAQRQVRLCADSASVCANHDSALTQRQSALTVFFPVSGTGVEGYPKVESTNLAFCNCRKKSQNARRGSCVIAPCIGGRAGRGRDVPVRPQKPHQRAPRRRRASAARGFRRCSTLRGPSTLARGETVRCAPARAPCAQGPGR
jgi:hypothetical protein